MANLKQAFEYASQNPESDFAKNLEQLAASGSLDGEAKKYGIDLTPFRPAPAEPTLASKLGQRGKDLVNAATTFGTLGANTVDPNTIPENKNLAALGGLAQAGMAPMKAAGAIGGAVGDVVGAGLKATGLDKVIRDFATPVAQSDVAQGAIKAFQSLPAEYQDYLKTGMDASNLVGLGIGKKAVTTGVEAGVNAIKPVVDTATGLVAKGAEKVLPTSESIMQRVARIPKGEQAKFQKLTGKSVGQFLDETGNYGTPDKIIEKLYNDFTQSKNTADNALAQIPGEYKSDAVTTALKELEGKVQRTSSPGAPDADLSRVNELVAKEKTSGLTMTEVNEVKRIYERRVRLDYLKSNVAEDVTRANNVDNALRNWQFTEAEKAGLTNLPEINKFTQANRQLMDALGKEQAGIGGNNALGLTDAILLAGGSPESIASLLTKKVFSDKGVQSFVAKNISKNPIKKGVPEANFKSSTQVLPQSQEKVLQSSAQSTPTTPKSKGLRGFVNPGELFAKNPAKINNIVSKLSSGDIKFLQDYQDAYTVKKLTKEMKIRMDNMLGEMKLTAKNSDESATIAQLLSELKNAKK
jgi:uncharacterized protein YnzC (UPF0291/DUF896 family)